MKVCFGIFLALMAFYGRGLAQGFINLNFEDAEIVYDSQFSYSGNVYASNAMPGWTAYLYGTAITDILYNDVPLGDPRVTLQGTNSGWPPVQGNYFAMLWGPFIPPGAVDTDSAAIGQTGQIPLLARSLIFWGEMGSMQITFDNQLLDFSVIGIRNNYNIYAADISPYAGQTGQLLFSAFYYSNTYGGPGIIDNIRFSANLVPEPGTSGLCALGGIFLVWQYRQKFSRNKA